ncbi:MAG: LytTR family DNA-binding domain-containing protein [Muribaculaceae bacterium]|nr:LytTR family DNA-binding domain-containing protein [Muribaculaceae bacterium]
MKPALIRCVAIDDEPLALEVIEKFCARMGGVEVTTFTDPREALDFMAGCAPDIAFLDIEMGNVSGLTVAAQLPASTCVVFTTAYLHYAAEGFNLDAVDYLHKPFSYSRFETAFAKALRRVEYNRSTPRQHSITVKQEYSNVTIPLDDIIYIEAMEGYSKIFRSKDRCVLSRVILKKLQAMLPERDFVRIHRSYVVPLSKVHSYNRQELTLKNGQVLPIGRQYADEVMSALAGR